MWGWSGIAPSDADLCSGHCLVVEVWGSLKIKKKRYELICLYLSDESDVEWIAFRLLCWRVASFPNVGR